MQRKLLYILLTLTLIGLLLSGCKEDKTGQTEPTADTVAEEKQLLNEPRWVTADPSLRIRDSVGSEGNIIGNIPLGEEVILLEESEDELTIAGATGRWSRVKWQELEGWVFGGFLGKELPVGKLLIGKWKYNKPDDDYTSFWNFTSVGKISIISELGNEEHGVWKVDQKNILVIELDNYSIKQIKYRILSINNKAMKIKLIEPASKDISEFTKIQ